MDSWIDLAKYGLETKKVYVQRNTKLESEGIAMAWFLHSSHIR